MKNLKKLSFKLLKIKKIEFTEDEIEMCDLEVPKHENFVLANGVITHNSANLEINAIRQADYLILKPSSLLQKDFERKKIKDIYENVEGEFNELKNTVGLTYLYADNYQGFVINKLPTFWSEKVSKGYSGK